MEQVEPSALLCALNALIARQALVESTLVPSQGLFETFDLRLLFLEQVTARKMRDHHLLKPLSHGRDGLAEGA